MVNVKCWLLDMSPKPLLEWQRCMFRVFRGLTRQQLFVFCPTYSPQRQSWQLVTFTPVVIAQPLSDIPSLHFT
ncbi:Secondary metabolism regulator laeA [Fusarium oxysporum f. sp. albedinis]|nr:Secondary metabolism regulator laeA [Fusarium oxysporum f. sp. albedinis]